MNEIRITVTQSKEIDYETKKEYYKNTILFNGEQIDVIRYNSWIECLIDIQRINIKIKKILEDSKKN